MFKNTNSKKWPLNRSVIVYQKGPPPQQQRIRKDEDWAGLAQKWVQMRETTDSSSASNGRPNNNVPPKDKDPRAAENLKVSYSELEDLATGRMSNYPVPPPSHISFDPKSMFDVALNRSKELYSKKKNANNLNKKIPSLIRKRPKSSLCDTYPNKLPCISYSAKTKFTKVQKDAAGNDILIEKYKLENTETIEMMREFASTLKLKSNCEITFLQDHRYFNLSGTRKAIELAKELIQMIIEKIHLVSGMKTMDVLEQQIEMNIPGNKVSSVIGPKGSTIQMLNEKTGCKIIIIANSFSYKIDRKLRITGESANCRHAQELIESLIKTNSTDDHSKIDDLKSIVGSSCTGQFNQDNCQEAIFYVPTRLSGMIIGSKGKMITHIKEQTGLMNLRISTDILPDRHKRHLVMRGTPQAIYSAKQLIQNKIKEFQMITGDFGPELTRQANNLDVVSYPWLNSFLGTIAATNDSKIPVSTSPLEVASNPWLNNSLGTKASTINSKNSIYRTPLEVASYPWLNNSFGTKATTNNSKNSIFTTPLEIASYPWLNNSLGTKATTNNSKNPVSTSSLQQSYLSLLSLIGKQSSQESHLANSPDSVGSSQQFASQYSHAIPYSNSTAECLRSGIVYDDNIKTVHHQKSHMVHQNFEAGQNNGTSMSEYQQSQTLQNIIPFTSESRHLQAEPNWQLPSSSNQYLQTEQYQQPSMIQNKHLLPRQNY